MREILFRGKAACGAWVQGNLIHRKIWASEFEVIRIDDSGFDNYTEYEVATETVGQFTGLTDKNGKRIFEGDIVKIGGIAYGCRWDDGNFEFGLYNKTESFGIAYADLPLRVIGNIHDNPELVEVTDNA